MDRTCNLSWLFASFKGPRTIRLIDTDLSARSELEAFAAGAVYHYRGLRFSVFREDEIDTYNDLLSRCYSEFDPLAHAVNLTKDEIKRHLFEEMFTRTNFLPFSVCAKADDGRLVGCYLSYPQSSEPIEPIYNHPESREVWESKLDVIEECINQCYPINFVHPDADGRMPPNSVDINTALHLFLATVHTDFKGKGYSYDLLLLSTALGYLKGLTFAFAECSNPMSSHFNKVGGYSFKPNLYSLFEYNGERPFARVTEDGIRFAFISI